MAVEFATDGSKPWQAYYNNPDVGVALQLLSFGNPEVLGDMVSVYPYINLPLTKATNFSLNIKLGGGLAFLQIHWIKTLLWLTRPTLKAQTEK